jgi:hypothetical protein
MRHHQAQGREHERTCFGLLNGRLKPDGKSEAGGVMPGGSIRNWRAFLGIPQDGTPPIQGQLAFERRQITIYESNTQVVSVI